MARPGRQTARPVQLPGPRKYPGRRRLHLTSIAPAAAPPKAHNQARTQDAKTVF
jgi:hypothetical protein